MLDRLRDGLHIKMYRKAWMLSEKFLSELSVMQYVKRETIKQLAR